jgi:hypothetical protein
MVCQNCGGEIKRIVLYRSYRLCSQQCQEMVKERTKVFEAPPKMDLRQQLLTQEDRGDTCHCTSCRRHPP